MKLVNNWDEFYDESHKDGMYKARPYASLLEDSCVFASDSVPARLKAIYNNPDGLFLSLYKAEGKIGGAILHHCLFDPKDRSKPHEATSVFALYGSAVDSSVMRVTTSHLMPITDPGMVIRTPTMDDLFAEEIIHNRDEKTILTMASDSINASSILSTSAILPLPLFLYEVVTQHGPFDWKAILLNGLAALETWSDQFGEHVPCDNINAAVYKAFQLFLILAKAAGVYDSTKLAAFFTAIPVDPLIVELADLPPLVIEEYQHITARHLLVPVAHGPPGPPGGFHPPPPPGNYDAIVQQALDVATKYGDLGRLAYEDKNKASPPPSSQAASPSFSSLLEDHQRMFLRLAAKDDATVPAEPSSFHLAFFGSKKAALQAFLQSKMLQYNSSFIVSKGLARLLYETDPFAVNRALFVHLSLMMFTARQDFASPFKTIGESAKLEANNVSGEELTALCKVEMDFPSTVDGLTAGLKDYAIFWNVLAGIKAGDKSTTTLIAARLREVRAAIYDARFKIAACMLKDPDYLAHLCNSIDNIIDQHMKGCKTKETMNTFALDVLRDVQKSLLFGSPQRDAIPHELAHRLPSYLLSSNKRTHDKAGGGGAAFAGGNHGGGDGGSPPKQQKAAAGKKLGKNPHALPELQIKKPFNTVFPDSAMGACPKGTNDQGESAQFCLHWLCLGKCYWKGCSRVHDAPTGQKLIELKAFIKARKQAASHDGGATSPTTSTDGANTIVASGSTLYLDAPIDQPSVSTSRGDLIQSVPSAAPIQLLPSISSLDPDAIMADASSSTSTCQSFSSPSGQHALAGDSMIEILSHELSLPLAEPRLIHSETPVSTLASTLLVEAPPPTSTTRTLRHDIPLSASACTRPREVSPLASGLPAITAPGLQPSLERIATHSTAPIPLIGLANADSYQLSDHGFLPTIPPDKRVMFASSSSGISGAPPSAKHPMSVHLSTDRIDEELSKFPSPNFNARSNPIHHRSTSASIGWPSRQLIQVAGSSLSHPDQDQDQLATTNPPSSTQRHPLLPPSPVICDQRQPHPEPLSTHPAIIDRGLDLPPAVWPHHAPSWCASIQQALLWSPPRMHSSAFRFDVSAAAAAHNMATLQAQNLDLGRTLFAHTDLPTCPGSNFRPIALLEPIFAGHPHWQRVRCTLLSGASFPLNPLEEELRKEELDAMIDYGNHKSATKERKAVLESLQEETAKGWHLALPVAALHLLPNVSVAPFGYVKQLKLQADGSRKEAGRITHDQTFCQRHAGTSVNKRVREEDLPPVFYGFALQRLLNRLIATRLLYHQLPVYLPKYDWKSAYKNCHFSLATLVQAATTTKGITEGFTLALLALRMTFGGSPCPTIFSDLSEMVTDAANWLVRDAAWNPEQLQSRFIEHITTTPVVYPDASTPFALARPTTVNALIPVDGLPFFDVFLDDHLGLIVHTNDDALLRGAHAIPLMLDVMGRPLRDDEPLPRNALIAVSKLIAEGCLTEIQVVLGWEIDTRKLLISLPPDKYRIYSEDIQELLDRQGFLVPAATLDTLFGRLVHVAVVVLKMRTCLGRIHSAKTRAEAASGKHRGKTRLSRAERRDLALCLELLDDARRGVDINLLVPRVPTIIIPTDACLQQVGGHDTTEGNGWRLPVPPGAPEHHINVLEFVGPLVGIWLAAIEGRLQRGDCVLAIGDNTTAAGWLRRSNFSDESSAPQMLLLARLLSEICHQYGICCYSQWRMGLDNVVPDLISRDFSSSGVLQDASAAQQDYVRSLLLTAAQSESIGVTRATHVREDMAWARWLRFAERAGFGGDPFMVDCSRGNRALLFVAFVQSVRIGEYSKARKGSTLVAGSVSSTVGGVAKAFTTAGYPDPRHDARGETLPVLARLFRGYRNEDPTTAHQQAIPLALLMKLAAEHSNLRSYQHFQLLITLATFFGLRSCEYLQIHQGDKVERRTLPIRICDTRFWKDGALVSHSSPSLHLSNSVSLVFRAQKNQVKDDSVTTHSSGDPRFCPVVAAAELVRSARRLIDKGLMSEDDDYFYYYEANDGTLAALHTKMALGFLRNFISSNNPESIGLSVDQIGLHSIRASAAMAMYMSGVPITTIQLQGRWRSEAFMEYIRKQVDLFSAGVSKKMLTVASFNTISATRFQPSENTINQHHTNNPPPQVTNTIPVLAPSLSSSFGISRAWGVRSSRGSLAFPS
ncbi:hypothetical protein MPSEU_000625900 [Mayamaea pseudoterrestris]|nr:hypothetical protein MPSEU_000625900 [Mayamaea pseudoterrestris]